MDGEGFPSLPLGGDLAVRPGEDVFTIGFPMVGVLGEAPKTTSGSITALSGIEDDARMFQISVQIQPGNSGGPLVLRATGNVIGITTATFNTAELIRDGRPVPQNINYAMKASYIRPLLASIPRLAAKLPAPHNEPRPWPEVQEAIENSVGLVYVYQNEPPAPKIARQPSPPPVASGEVDEPEVRPGFNPWVFADSSYRRLTHADLARLNKDQLWRARNEIYARNGLIFSSPRGQALARSLGEIYRGTERDQSVVMARLNAVEQANVLLIGSYE